MLSKFVSYLKQAFHQAQLRFSGKLEPLGKKKTFSTWLNAIAGGEWVVYAKPPFGGPQQVLKYLARYTHRVAISNQRLVSLQDGHVTFRWKDYSQGSQHATMTLGVTEFVRRFLLHVVPSGFVKIRHFGFLANRSRREKITLCRKLLTAKAEAKPQIPSSAVTSRSQPEPVQRCPLCKVGRMNLVEIFFPHSSVIVGPFNPFLSATLQWNTA
jgi:hypothetical protein